MKAWELLSDPNKWTQGYYARNAQLDPVPVKDCSAHCFCLIGAIERCYGDDRTSVILPSDVLEKENKLREIIGQKNIARWNDAPERKHEEVVAALKAVDL